jgi:hypothetical protein
MLPRDVGNHNLWPGSPGQQKLMSFENQVVKINPVSPKISTVGISGSNDFRPKAFAGRIIARIQWPRPFPLSPAAV